MTERIAIGVEATPKKTFASALEWPGWSRAGRDEAVAVAALAASAGRFAIVARGIGLAFGPVEPGDIRVVERLPGTATTAFGAPDVVFAMDARPTDAADGERLATLVRAAWAVLDKVAAIAAAELRKGPRGGGRDRDAIVAHVVAAESAYARRIGLRLREPDPGDVGAVAAIRAAITDVLARPTDGGPIPGGRWPARYAVRRIAWHVLDHAWEIEDRAEPA
ncbi:MAG TPA: hypothetical protein VIK16_05020 [Candidatus Limnocylindrales bacterium]